VADGATTTNARRAAIARWSNAGKATCARRGEPIQPEDEWHVDHNDARDGYLGVSCAAGNLRDGGHTTTGKRRPHPFVQQPYRWSQRWFDDPPIGTISYDGRRNPEITSARPNGSLLMRRGSTSPNSRKKACHLGD
jgi:hypothetical protein